MYDAVVWEYTRKMLDSCYRLIASTMYEKECSGSISFVMILHSLKLLEVNCCKVGIEDICPPDPRLSLKGAGSFILRNY